MREFSFDTEVDEKNQYHYLMDYWTTSEGERLHRSEMTVNHLGNVINVLRERQKQSPLNGDIFILLEEKIRLFQQSKLEKVKNAFE